MTAPGPGASRFDVYLSCDPSDRESGVRLAEALRARGFGVFVPPGDADHGGDSLDVLDTARVLVAWFSQRYPRLVSSQNELVRAMWSAAADASVGRRVLIVNPESGVEHIFPESLRALARPVTADTVERLAGGLESSIVSVVGSMESTGRNPAPPIHGIQTVACGPFVGRFPQLTRIHGALQPAARLQPSVELPAVVEIHGSPGAGTSRLALEYALRFGAEYPGGIFWLRAHGGRAGMAVADRKAERDRQMRDFASSLGVIVAHRKSDEIRADLATALGRAGRPCLWIVDDLGGDIGPVDYRHWLGPHPVARTIVTTSARQPSAGAAVLRLEALTSAEAVAMVGTDVTDAGFAGVLPMLAAHPLALNVALGLSEDGLPWDSLAERPARRSSQDLALADALAEQLPEPLAVCLAAILGRAVGRLSDAGRDVLRLASVVSEGPIPFGFMSDVFQRVERGDARSAQARVFHGVADVDRLRLSEQPGSDTDQRSIHPVIALAASLLENDHARFDVIKAAAVSVFLDRLPRQYEPDAYASLDVEISHARYLVHEATTVSETELLGRIARYDLVRGAYESGVRLFGRQFENCRRLFGEKHRETAETMSSLAGAHFAAGEVSAARELHQAVVEIRREINGEEHPDTLGAMSNLATTLVIEGRYGAARETQEQLLEIKRRTLGLEHAETTNAAWKLFQTLNRLGDRRSAQQVLTHDLSWLLSRMPSTLGAEQRRVRGSVADLPEFG